MYSWPTGSWGAGKLDDRRPTKEPAASLAGLFPHSTFLLRSVGEWHELSPARLLIMRFASNLFLKLRSGA